jgi:aspartate aminotransferase-like enzyme
VPRLRERLCLERQLADDAREHGLEREIDRHQRAADRLRGLLSDLGEPSGTPEDMP